MTQNFERTKAIRALDRAHTVIDHYSPTPSKYGSPDAESSIVSSSAQNESGNTHEEEQMLLCAELGASRKPRFARKFCIPVTILIRY